MRCPFCGCDYNSAGVCPNKHLHLFDASPGPLEGELARLRAALAAAEARAEALTKERDEAYDAMCVQSDLALDRLHRALAAERALADFYFMVEDRGLNECVPEERRDGGKPGAPVHATSCGTYRPEKCPMCLARRLATEDEAPAPAAPPESGSAATERCRCGHDEGAHRPGSDADDWSCEECSCVWWTPPPTPAPEPRECGECGHARHAPNRCGEWVNTPLEPGRMQQGWQCRCIGVAAAPDESEGS